MNQNELDKAKLLAQDATLQMYCYSSFDKENNKLKGEPLNAFSGCIYKNMVLSVYHGIDTKTITAFAGCDDNGRPINAVLSPSYFSRGIIDVNNNNYISGEIVDFFYANKGEIHFKCECIDEYSGQRSSRERFVFDCIGEPNISDDYFFCGCTYSSISKPYDKEFFEIPNRIYFEEQFKICHFDGYGKDIDKKDINNDFYYRFEIDEEIDELSDLKGCSGAPILNSKGELISLICGGWEKSKFVYGLNLKRIMDLVNIVEGFSTQLQSHHP